MNLNKARPQFLYILAVIFIVVLIGNSIQAFTGQLVNVWVLPITSILLGIGLVIEGEIRKLIRPANSYDTIKIVHVVTALTGLIVLFSGILTLPFIGQAVGIYISGTVGNVMGYSYLFAALVVFVEVFIVK